MLSCVDLEQISFKVFEEFQTFFQSNTFVFNRYTSKIKNDECGWIWNEMVPNDRSFY